MRPLSTSEDRSIRLHIRSKLRYSCMAAGDLWQELRKGKRMLEPSARALAITLLHALNYLHKRVLCTETSSQTIYCASLVTIRVTALQIKLTDFGLSAYLPTKATTQLVKASNCGTQCYKAPELASGRPYNYTVRLSTCTCCLSDTSQRSKTANHDYHSQDAPQKHCICQVS